MAKNERENMRTIGHWCREFGTDTAVYTGVTIQEQWRSGREVTEAEYKAAVNKFLTGGRKDNA